MATTICMLNFKGGVGKTTCTINLGAALTQLKKKVLIIDLDSQCTASNTFKKASPYDGETIYDYLVGKTQEAFAYETLNKRLDYVPSSGDMKFVEIELNRMRSGRERVLRKFVEQVSPAYDYILLDCPPGDGVVTDNALMASQKVIVPVICEEYSMYGLRDIINAVDTVKEDGNSDLDLLGIVVSQFDRRVTLHRTIEDGLRSSFGAQIFDTKIYKHVSYAEYPSADNCQSIFDYAPKGQDAAYFLNLGKEVIKRVGKK